MKNIDKEKIQQKVLNCLVDKYKINPITAMRMIKDSVFKEMLEDELEFVVHYGIEYWAKDIINDEEYMNIAYC